MGKLVKFTSHVDEQQIPALKDKNREDVKED